MFKENAALNIEESWRLHSWDELKALQNRTNHEPLSEALMSSTPDITLGWLAMMPTVRPVMRPKPITMFCA